MEHQDVTDLVQLLEPEVLGDIITFNGDGIIITDEFGLITLVNPALMNMTGFTLDDFIGNTPNIMNSGTQPKQFFTDLFEVLHTEGHWHGEIWNKKKNGELILMEETITVIRDEFGHIIHYVAIIRDNTEIRSMEDKLKEMAFRDPLTNLYNRRYFFEYFDQQIKDYNRNERPFALMVIDLDNFSDVNNTYGHDFGDNLLVKISERLTHTFKRQVDVVARHGGDEFVVLLPDIGEKKDDIYDNCEILCKKLIKSLSQPYNINGYSIKSTASIGVGYCINNCDDINDVISQADSSMYKGKRTGKNTYKIYPIIS